MTPAQRLFFFRIPVHHENKQRTVFPDATGFWSHSSNLPASMPLSGFFPSSKDWDPRGTWQKHKDNRSIVLQRHPPRARNRQGSLEKGGLKSAGRELNISSQ